MGDVRLSFQTLRQEARQSPEQQTQKCAYDTTHTHTHPGKNLQTHILYTSPSSKSLHESQLSFVFNSIKGMNCSATRNAILPVQKFLYYSLGDRDER